MGTALDASMFVDPETHEPVVRATEADLERLNAALSAGSLRRQDGGALPESIQGAYLSNDLRWAYPDVDGLASFLVGARLLATE